jgi:hypothetical protein
LRQFKNRAFDSPHNKTNFVERKAMHKAEGCSDYRSFVRTLLQQVVAIPIAGMMAATLIFLPANPVLAAQNTHYFATVSPWYNATQSYVQAWDGNSAHPRVAIISKDTNGVFNGCWLYENGTPIPNGCITRNLPNSTPTHRGISDIFPGGDYVVMTAEKSDHLGFAVGAPDSLAIPGKGVYNDIYIAKSDGSRAWLVRAIPSDEDHAIIWPRLNKSGTQLVWAEMYRGYHPWEGDILNPHVWLGRWQLKLADVKWKDNNTTPWLDNIRTYEPGVGEFYEPYGFSPPPDESKILFSSTYKQDGIYHAQIFKVKTDFTGLQQLTTWPSDGQGNWREFAFYGPDSSHIMFGSTTGSEGDAYSTAEGGYDYWIMSDSGSRPERVTYLNEPWSPHYRNYTNVGGWAVNPRDSNHILVSACHIDAGCTNSEIVSVRLSSITGASGTGLKGEYFSDASLTSANKVLTRIDSEIDFSWKGFSVGKNVPTNNFSVRWTGFVKPYAAGTYTFCTYTDDGVRLLVDNVELFKIWSGGPINHCAAAQYLSAGQHSITMEYYESSGNATAKLYWKVPGHTDTPEIIPPSQLTPAP